MKSIKPGRGPSMMGGIASVGMGLFGLLWIFFVLRMGGGFFALFGLVFVLIAVAQAVYNFKNATGKNRYSAFDITDSREEPDPLNLRFGQPEAPAGDAGGPAESPEDVQAAFCPFCGTPVEENHVFCLRCGRKLP